MGRKLEKSVLAVWDKEVKTVDDIYMRLVYQFGIIPGEKELLQSIRILKRQKMIICKLSNLSIHSDIEITHKGKNESKRLKEIKEQLPDKIKTSTQTTLVKRKKSINQLKRLMNSLMKLYKSPGKYLYDKIDFETGVNYKESIKQLTLLSLKKVVLRIKTRSKKYANKN